jgi:diguanylate cyclase (GGDEF)-like protein/PAS domain S-box-containing protein
VEYEHNAYNTKVLDDLQTVKTEVVTMLFESCSRSFIVSFIVAATLLYVVSGAVESHLLWIWAVIFTVCYSVRQLISIAYHQQTDLITSSINWLKWFRISTMACGMTWGLASIIFYHASHDITHQAFIIIILIGVSGGAIMTYSIDSVTSNLFAGSIYFMTLPSFLFPATTASLALAAMLAVYILYISLSGATVAKKLQENMLMRITAFNQEEKIKVLAERQKMHVDLTPMGVIEWDCKFNAISWNYSAEQIFQYSTDEALNMNISTIMPEDKQDEIIEFMERLLEKGTTQTYHSENIRNDGSEIYCEWTFTPLKDKNNDVIGIATLVQDKTDFKKNQDEIQYLAYYDLLTNLPNRRLLMDRLDQAVIFSKRNHSVAAALFIDLDNFKNLNDLHGHQIGDLLLKEVSLRLTSLVRDEDTIARFAGDEFVIILESLGKTLDEASTTCKVVVEKIIEGLNQEYKLGGHAHRTSCSIGICLFEGDSLSVSEILKRADMAMFQAKKAGRNGLQFFNEELQPKLEYRASLASDLRGAEFNNELIPYYQIQVNDKNKVIGSEMLLRWEHPKHGLIAAGDFIPIAEESSLINTIGQSLINHACQQLKAWESNSYMNTIRLSVNISARHFGQANFVDEVKSALNSTMCSPNLLRLELTESLVQKNIDDLASKMNLLKNIGVSLSLDDFGTGYSSLSVLRNFPIDELKIDRSFVMNMLNNKSDASIIEMIIGISKNLGMDVIAEGVETIEQEYFLRESGCFNYQGYLYGRPVPLEQLEKMLVLYDGNEKTTSDEALLA